MAYTPTDWVNDVTPVNEALMDKIETGIADAHAALPPDPTGLDEKWLTVEAGTIIWDDLPASSTIDYEAAWNPATAYTPGDVVTYNGINYLAVNPSTGVVPTSVEQSGYVASNAVTVAGTPLYQTKLLASDTQPAHRVLGDGRHDWGAGGGAALDTNLYRGAAGALATDGNLWVGGAGGISLGPDTNLYRAAANILQTDDHFQAVRASTGDIAFAVKNVSAGNPRWFVNAGGTFAWSDGTSAEDTILRRNGAGILQTDGNFFATGQVRAAAAQSGQVAVGNLPSGNPSIAFGTAADVNLYRSAADVLQTDDSFVVNVGGNPIGISGPSGVLRWGYGASDQFNLLSTTNAYGKIRLANILDQNGAQVLGIRRTGWGAMTGTKLRTTVVTDSVTLPELAKRVGALIDDLMNHGLIQV